MQRGQKRSLYIHDDIWEAVQKLSATLDRSPSYLFNKAAEDLVANAEQTERQPEPVAA